MTAETRLFSASPRSERSPRRLGSPSSSSEGVLTLARDKRGALTHRVLQPPLRSRPSRGKLHFPTTSRRVLGSSLRVDVALASAWLAWKRVAFHRCTVFTSRWGNRTNTATAFETPLEQIKLILTCISKLFENKRRTQSSSCHPDTSASAPTAGGVCF